MEDYQIAIWNDIFARFLSLFNRPGIIYYLFRRNVEFIIPFCVLIGGFIVFYVFKFVVSGGRDY